MDGKELGSVDGTTFVNGLTNDINDTTESARANGHLNGVSSVLDRLATDETLGGVESNGAHVVATQVLGNLKDETVLGSLDLKGVENRRKLTFELHIDDGTNNLRDLSSGAGEASYATTGQSSVTRDNL